MIDAILAVMTVASFGLLGYFLIRSVVDLFRGVGA